MVEIRHLKLIEAIERLGSLKRAASELNLTQSALSHQLKQLESYVESPLFHRANNQLYFTQFGKEFYDLSRGVLDKLVEMENRVEENKIRMANEYIHGYSQDETQRLYDQANSIASILHWDSQWPAGAKILEAGCGVGAQTKIIAPQNPKGQFTCVDISEKSLKIAQQLAIDLGLENVQFSKEDLFQLSFPDQTFDHIFLCFVLEHVKSPISMLRELKRVLKAQGNITLIEGDHGSTYFHPDSQAARKVVDAQVQLQKQKGGNANIGRALYPLLEEAGFETINISPRQVYVDDSKPELVKGFTLNTFTAMIKGIQSEVISNGMLQQQAFKEGVDALQKTAAGGGTFCYTFFKGVAIKV